jgi:hypothetical protein
MADEPVPPMRYAPAIPLPPYGSVPGHDLPYPVNDPAGHLFAGERQSHEPPIAPAVAAAGGVAGGLPHAEAIDPAS